MELGRRIADARARVVAALAVQFRDLDLAEDAYAEAAARCLALEEPPRNVAGWLFTASRRKALDALRRRDAERRALEGAAMTGENADVVALPEAIPDERLRLIFICCHPALGLEARTALALKVICGLPVSSIAQLFVTGETAMFQRITRAKRKVAEAAIAFELPPRRAWGERLEAVLLTLELAYTAAYQDAGATRDPELSAEVARLAALAAQLLPDEPEVLGLAALVWLARSREAARVDEGGAMVPLSQQDTAKWDMAAIGQAREWLDAAAAHRASGAYQVMAAIQLTHARRAYDGRTDWEAVLKLYNVLVALRPGPIPALNRALALAKVEGAEAGLAALAAIDGERLSNARPWHVARGELLAQARRGAEAAEALRAALALDPPRAERLFLERKLEKLVGL